MVRVFGGIALALLLSCAGSARAESPLEMEARQHYTRGEQLFDQASYAEALDEFQRSYDLSRYPAILYKIALCRDELGPPAAAIAAYQRYLAADPKSTRKEGIDQRIAALRALQPHKPPPPSIATKPPPAPVAPAAALTPPPAPRERTPVYKRWWVWTIVGAAAAGAAVGLGVGLAPPRAPNDFQPSLGRIGPGLGIR